MQEPVRDAEGGPVAPAQGQAELVVLAVGDVGEVHHRRNDLAGDERVVVVELAVVALAQPALGSVRKRQLPWCRPPRRPRCGLATEGSCREVHPVAVACASSVRGDERMRSVPRESRPWRRSSPSSPRSLRARGRVAAARAVRARTSGQCGRGGGRACAAARRSGLAGWDGRPAARLRVAGGSARSRQADCRSAAARHDDRLGAAVRLLADRPDTWCGGRCWARQSSSSGWRCSCSSATPTQVSRTRRRSACCWQSSSSALWWSCSSCCHGRRPLRPSALRFSACARACTSASRRASRSRS